MEAASKEVQNLKDSDIIFLTTIKVPSQAVELVVRSLCIIFGIKPNKPAPNDKDKKLNYWVPAQKQLLNSKLKKRIMEMETKKDNLDDKIGRAHV